MFGGFWQSKLCTLLAIIVIVFLGFALLRIQPQKVVVEKRVKSFQDKIMELEKSNVELAQLLDYFKSDAYLEREAKLKLNVRRPEEQVVFLHEDDVSQKAASRSEADGFAGWRGRFNSLVRWVKEVISKSLSSRNS